MQVPVIPDALVNNVVQSAHHSSGHGNWQTMYYIIRSRAYFPGIASACNEFVTQCSTCKAANPAKSRHAVPPTRSDIPSGPWSELVLDTLELGDDRSGKYHCVLVCVDVFTKWVEVLPLRRHNAASVASAFTSMCLRWGVPDVVRMDNGTEFVNAIVQSIFDVLGVRVRTGAVRHPQSQGAAERLNRTLLGLIRKVLESSADWKEDLDILLHYYRTRPHSVTRLSPMEAMVGWMPRQWVVERQEPPHTLSAWVDNLSARVACIHDLIESELSKQDFIEDPAASCTYSVGDRILLRHPTCQKKSLSPFEASWRVHRIVSPPPSLSLIHQMDDARQ